MSNIVPAEQIEQIVGRKRHAYVHYARAVSEEEMVYILHSQRCKDAYPDLRDCPLSAALDYGINQFEWSGFTDRPVRVRIENERLVPFWFYRDETYLEELDRWQSEGGS